ncbi:hypothetical protein HPB47_020604 [Ixodes persulcatus]|uniref:Uncharacterized protein n=1 Tax=Ixodes persulcatus TaxID=34615 RepID=A0AC60QI47_IXOPE|nr:hypothetical protein HPB47_020604 [Ixodes persulcatus]
MFDLALDADHGRLNRSCVPLRIRAAEGRWCAPISKRKAHLLPNVWLGPAAASGVQGPRLISELPPRLLFSNSSGSSVACLASGEPAPSVRWLGDDGEEAPDVSRLRHTRPDGTLVFLPFRPDQFRRDVHEARYRCAAANAIGTVVSSQVHVTAEVVARLSAGDADDYDKVKSSLLKRYRLSAEAFRQRFRNASKKSSEGYSEFAYGLKTNLIEWLKSEEVYESRDKVVECVCLEQFFRSIPQSVKLWVQDRVGVDSVERAAELAEEYATRRKLSGEESESGRSDQRKTFRQENSETPESHLHDNHARWLNDGKFYESFLQFLHDAGLH